MEFAAIADIHGNDLALEAVLDDIAFCGVDEIVNLGDHLSGPLRPRRTAEILTVRDMFSISGDQDRRMIEMWRDGRRADRGDLRQLDLRHIEYLARMPPTAVFRDTAFLCHGNSSSDNAFWLDRLSSDNRFGPSSASEVESTAGGINWPIILCAHTHIPRFVRLEDGRLVINPGSVGCPAYEMSAPVRHVVETGTPSACYAILRDTPAGWHVSLRHVPYDNEAMANIALDNGALGWAKALRTGRIDRAV